MSVETNVTFISSLDPSQPGSQDQGVEGDNHIRNIKLALRNTFPTLSKAVTANIDFVNQAEARVQALEANKMSTTQPFLSAWMDAKGYGITNLAYSIQPTEAVSNQRLGDVIQYFLQNVHYRVGCIWCTTSLDDPNVIMGFGTWTRFAQGRAIVGAGASTDENGTTIGVASGQEFGQWTHTLTIGEIPSHNHDNGSFNKLLAVDGTGTVTAVDNSASQVNVNGSGGTIQAAGGGGAHVNYQPSVALYIWRRVA